MRVCTLVSVSKINTRQNLIQAYLLLLHDASDMKHIISFIRTVERVWDIEGFPNYFFGHDKQLYRYGSRGRVKTNKWVIIGSTKGYILKSKFFSEKQLHGPAAAAIALTSIGYVADEVVANGIFGQRTVSRAGSRSSMAMVIIGGTDESFANKPIYAYSILLLV